ncbi:MAG: hypothetical protein ABSH51_28525 [Solirubrobacteraceae bacterium]|jgi:hypothetical protein
MEASQTAADAGAVRLVNPVEVRGRAARLLKRKGHIGMLRLEGDRMSFEGTDGHVVWGANVGDLQIIKRKRRGFLVSIDGKEFFVAPRAKPRRKRPGLPHNPVAWARWGIYGVLEARDLRQNRRVVQEWTHALPGESSEPCDEATGSRADARLPLVAS